MLSKRSPGTSTQMSSSSMCMHSRSWSLTKLTVWGNRRLPHTVSRHRLLRRGWSSSSRDRLIVQQLYSNTHLRLQLQTTRVTITILDQWLHVRSTKEPTRLLSSHVRVICICGVQHLDCCFIIARQQLALSYPEVSSSHHWNSRHQLLKLLQLASLTLKLNRGTVVWTLAEWSLPL